jgi:hypothetical protein
MRPQAATEARVSPEIHAAFDDGEMTHALHDIRNALDRDVEDIADMIRNLEL